MKKHKFCIKIFIHSLLLTTLQVIFFKHDLMKAQSFSVQKISKVKIISTSKIHNKSQMEHKSRFQK
jgi:hypothetical protein